MEHEPPSVVEETHILSTGLPPLEANPNFVASLYPTMLSSRLQAAFTIPMARACVLVILLKMALLTSELGRKLKLLHGRGRGCDPHPSPSICETGVEKGSSIVYWLCEVQGETLDNRLL